MPLEGERQMDCDSKDLECPVCHGMVKVQVPAAPAVPSSSVECIHCKSILIAHWKDLRDPTSGMERHADRELVKLEARERS